MQHAKVCINTVTEILSVSATGSLTKSFLKFLIDWKFILSTFYSIFILKDWIRLEDLYSKDPKDNINLTYTENLNTGYNRKFYIEYFYF